MKLLVIFAVFGLAAAGPVAEPEAQPEADPEADPALVYSTGLTSFPYTGAYASPYTAYSGYPTAYSGYPTAYSGYPSVYRTGYSSSHVPLTYSSPLIIGRKKRSADPEAQPEADPEADPALVYSTGGLTYPYIGTPYTYPYRTLPTTYSSLPYTYSHLTYPATSYTATYGRKKRSADPEPQPEADPEADPQLLYSAGYTGLPTYPHVSTYGTYPSNTYPLTYGVRPVTYSRPLTYAYGK